MGDALPRDQSFNPSGTLSQPVVRSLESIQRWMQAVIVNPDEAAFGANSSTDASANEIDAARGSLSIEDMILPSKLLSSQQRMGIYANAYYARLLECLRDEFPALVSLLGEETFNAFGIDYLQSHPSQSYTLADLGQYFPAYLRENQTLALDEDAGAESSTAPDGNSYCFDLMIDLALLERTYSEVFSGQGIEDQQTLCADELATIPPDQISNLRLLPSPCVRLLKLHTQAHEYAIAVRKGTASNSRLPAQKTTFLVITRLHYVVRTIDAESLEFELLEHLVNNVCLGDAIARVAESSMFPDSLSDEQQWTNRIYEWFQKWAENRLFISFRTSE